MLASLRERRTATARARWHATAPAPPPPGQEASARARSRLHERPRPPRAGTPRDGAGVFLVLPGAVVRCGSQLVWIAGAIAGSGPVLVSLSDAGTMLAKLSSHVSDWACGWPSTVR